MTFKQDVVETPVIFRRLRARLRATEGGGVIALFPAEPGDMSPYTCSSYVHVGQHGAADPQHVMQNSRPATREEYEDLKRELESAPYGYRLKMYRRLNRKFLELRKAELKRMRG
jgi:hypothetical protein